MENVLSGKKRIFFSSFSAISTPIFANKYAMENSSRDLQIIYAKIQLLILSTHKSIIRKFAFTREQFTRSTRTPRCLTRIGRTKDCTPSPQRLARVASAPDARSTATRSPLKSPAKSRFSPGTWRRERTLVRNTRTFCNAHYAQRNA